MSPAIEELSRLPFGVVPLDLGGEVGRSRPFPFCAVDTTEDVVTCDTLLTLNPIDAEIGEE